MEMIQKKQKTNIKGRGKNENNWEKDTNKNILNLYKRVKTKKKDCQNNTVDLESKQENLLNK